MAKQDVIKFSKDGKIEKILLANSYLQIEVSTLGATLVSLRLLKSKDQRDVVCGLKSAEDYLAHDKYLGASVGRVAGRIDKGCFTLNGVNYQLACNNNGNALHGGLEGFDRRQFSYSLIKNNDEELGVKLSYTSLDGEEGFPGEVHLDVVYLLCKNTLKLTYTATTNKDTLINLTNHSYFNLDGHTSPSALQHTLQIHADELLMIDEDSCPRGDILKVEGTPFDFRKPKKIIDCIQEEHDQLSKGNGIDHFYIFNQPQNQIKLWSGDETCNLTITTNQVGANIYSANYLDGKVIGKENVAYPQRCAICLETQNYGNDIHIHENPTTVLKVGDTYEAYTEYTFEVEE